MVSICMRDPGGKAKRSHCFPVNCLPPSSCIQALLVFKHQTVLLMTPHYIEEGVACDRPLFFYSPFYHAGRFLELRHCAHISIKQYSLYFSTQAWVFNWKQMESNSSSAAQFTWDVCVKPLCSFTCFKLHFFKAEITRVLDFAVGRTHRFQWWAGKRHPPFYFFSLCQFRDKAPC